MYAILQFLKGWSLKYYELGFTALPLSISSNIYSSSDPTSYMKPFPTTSARSNFSFFLVFIPWSLGGSVIQQKQYRLRNLDFSQTIEIKIFKNVKCVIYGIVTIFALNKSFLLCSYIFAMCLCHFPIKGFISSALESSYLCDFL